MWLFAVFFLPCILVLYFINHANRGKVYSVLLGLGCGAAYVVFAILFGSEYRVISVNFFKNFSWLFLQEAFLPTTIITILFFLLFRDSFQFKVNVLFLVLAGFYTLYIPFRILFRSGAFTAFTLFLKPILLACFIVGFSFAIRLFYKNLKGQKATALFVLPIFLGLGCTAAPAITEVFWYAGSPAILWLSTGMLEILFAVTLLALNHVNVTNMKKTRELFSK